MQLKIRRTQKTGGLLTKSNIFCLDAVVSFSREERDAITKYKLGSEVVYVSEAARQGAKNAEASVAQGGFGGLVKGVGLGLLNRINLVVTMNSLVNGTHIECKDMAELISAEEAILTACKNVRLYLDNAKAFDGREILFDFSSDEARVIEPKLPAGRAASSVLDDDPEFAAAMAAANAPKPSEDDRASPGS